MTVKYLDPYKDDPYGKLRGDKTEAYVKVEFDEAKLHFTDNACILAAYVTSYSGVIRSYKANEPLTSGLCAIPIYCSEYEIRQKGLDGQWTGVKYQPSIYEKALYKYIKKLSDESSLTESFLAGDISFMPNGMVAALDEAGLQNMLVANIHLEAVEPTGKLPDYTPPSAFSQRKGGSYGKELSPEDKILFIKNQIIEDVNGVTLTSANTLAEITKAFLYENSDNENFIEIYFDMLMCAIK